MDYLAPNTKTKSTPRFEGYTGRKLWLVKHPDYAAIEVLAPSMQAAIVTAAAVWGRRWQDYDFYAYCETSYRGTEKATKKA